MDIERIIQRASRRYDIQQAALKATQEEIKVLTGVEGLTKAVAALQVKRDRQTNALEVTKQLLDHYTKLHTSYQDKLRLNQGTKAPK